MSYPDEIKANLERADAAPQAAQVLLDNQLLDDAASRTYYAAFYAASALLLSKDLSFNSHTGVLRAISLNFIKNGQLEQRFGKALNWLASLRQLGDYGETNHVTQTSADNDRQQLEEIEANLEAQHTERRRIKQTRASLQNQLELAQYHLDLAQEKYITEGGKIAAEEAALKAKKTQLAADIETLRQSLRELAAGELPLMLIRPLLKKAQPQAEDEIKHQQFELAKDLIDKNLEDFIEITTL